MTTPRRPDFQKLTDFATGRLSPEEALEVLDLIEKDPEVSKDLDLVLELEKIPREEWEKIRSEGPRR